MHLSDNLVASLSNKSSPIPIPGIFWEKSFLGHFNGVTQWNRKLNRNAKKTSFICEIPGLNHVDRY